MSQSIGSKVLTLNLWQRSVPIAESISILVGCRKFQRNGEEGKRFFSGINPNLVGIRTRVRFNTRVLSLTVLGSGSAGNCSLIATDQCRLLVDAGFSARQIVQRLETIGVRPETLDAILITHEHSDHVAGLEIFCRRFGIPIYTNPLTAEILRRGFLVDFSGWNLFQTGRAFAVKDIEIQSFYVPHDAVEPTAFVFTEGEGSIGVLMDLGYAPKLALERIRQVHTLFIETNHDERMLQGSIGDHVAPVWIVNEGLKCCELGNIVELRFEELVDILRELESNAKFISDDVYKLAAERKASKGEGRGGP